MNKCLYKIELYIIKVIPVLLALISFINTTLFYFGIDLYILTYIGGVSFITLGFLYLTSYVFKFCSYHRMYLHYILIVNILSYIDMEYTIPLSDFNMYITYLSLTLCLIVVVTILKIRNGKFLKETNSKIT